MCGIAGIISLKDNLSEKDLSVCENMTNVLRHRGPDNTSFFKDNDCLLGNTRLKIIDLSDQANLPMSNNRNDLIIAYNGEVTNFKELKQQYNLEDSYPFKTHSDTEVLLALYEKIGTKMFKELSGQFVFTLYDKRIKKSFIVRDQFGIRPIFYSIHKGNLYFASEIKSFLEIPDLSLEVDKQAIYDYFSLIYIPGQRTPFSQVKELDGGHFIEIDFSKKDHLIHEYYNLEYCPDYSMTEKEAIDGFYEVMEDSVRRNLISDAPLGMTLSGGLDTSSMLGIMHKLGKSNEVHTFSLKMGEKTFDESKYQRLMSDQTGSIHHEITVNPEDVIQTLIEQMAFMDEPNGNGAVIPSYLLAKEAKKFVKVLISGEGGDEITNGYDTHLANKVRRIYRKAPSLLRKLAFLSAHSLPVSLDKVSFEFMAKRFTEGSDKSPAAAHQVSSMAFISQAVRAGSGSSAQTFSMRVFPFQYAMVSSTCFFVSSVYVNLSQGRSVK